MARYPARASISPRRPERLPGRQIDHWCVAAEMDVKELKWQVPDLPVVDFTHFGGWLHSDRPASLK